MPAYLFASPDSPEKPKRFADVRSMSRVADLFQTYLAIEAVVNQAMPDDLRILSPPAGPTGPDRPHLRDD